MLPAILATLRKRESGSPEGNYSARAKGATASGAYQFIDPTWRNLTQKYGVGSEYPHAYMAPPQVQDEVAKRQVMGLLQQGYGPEAIAKTWYAGNPQGQMSAKAIALNNGLTADQYAANWMRDFAKLSGAGYSNPSQMNTSSGVMAPKDFTPDSSPSTTNQPMLFGSQMPDTTAPVGDPMAQSQQPDYMAQFAKFAGGFGGGGGQEAMPQMQFPQARFEGVQVRPATPVQMASFGRRGRARGLLG